MRRRILIKYEKDDGRGIIDGYEYVDLGLPSGLKWATCNVNASSETDYGDYYTFGGNTAVTKESSSNSYYQGNLDQLPLSADTAHNKMKGSWRMPTRTECYELINNTQKEAVIDTNNSNNYIGIKFISNQDSNKVLFIPTGGILSNNWNGTVSNAGRSFYIWTSDKVTNSPQNAYCLAGGMQQYYMSDFSVSINQIYRYYGLNVRGVHE